MSALRCECGATARDTSKERNRFKRRHPRLCQKHKAFMRQLAEGTRSVDADAPEPEMLNEVRTRQRR
jgi:hypothetical protein